MPPETEREAVMLTFDEFKKMDLRVAKVVACEPHPNADKLLVLKIDIGEEEPRQIVAGLRQWYLPENLVGKEILVVANLEPATLRGIESHGMLLAAQSGDDVVILAPEKELPPGARVL